MTEPIAVIRSYDDLVAALRAAKAKHGLSNKWCDDIGGLTDGQTDKVLGPTQSKGLSRMLMDVYFEMFAIEFHMVINLDAAKRMESRWEQRERGKVAPPQSVLSKKLIERAKPHVFKAAGKLGASIRLSKLSPELRSKIARKAGKSRMRNVTKAQRSTMNKKGWETRRARMAEQQRLLLLPSVEVPDSLVSDPPQLRLCETA